MLNIGLFTKFANLRVYHAIKVVMCVHVGFVHNLGKSSESHQTQFIYFFTTRSDY